KLGGPKVNVGQFTAKEPGKTKIACRAVGPSTTPDERPFEEFIRKALIDELTVADTLTGQLNKIDFDSMAGEWELDLTVASSTVRAGSARETRPRPRRRRLMASSTRGSIGPACRRWGGGAPWVVSRHRVGTSCHPQQPTT